MKRIIAIVLSAAVSFAAHAQKKPLDHSVYDKWESTSSVMLTDDGKIVCYQVKPQEGDSRLVFNNLGTGMELTVERGESAVLSSDGRWAVFRIKAPFKQTREAKIKKKKASEMPKDSVGFIDLKDFTLYKTGPSGSFRTSVEGNTVIAYETGEDKSSRLVILQPASGRSDTISNVDKYTLEHYGSKLAVVYKKSKDDSLSVNGVSLFSLDNMTEESLSEGKKFYSAPKFNDKGDKLVFLASTDSAETGSKHCSVFLYENGNTEEIIPQGYSGKLPSGFTVTEKANPRFSRLSDRIFLGIAEPVPPMDTTLVEFETAGLDIWNWDAFLIPPAQKAIKSAIEDATVDAVINISRDRHRIVPIGNNLFEETILADGGEGSVAIVLNNNDYYIHSTWDNNSFHDIYKVDLETGERTLLFEKLNGKPSVSPCGRYLIWYSHDDLDFYCYNLGTGEKVNLTANIEGFFYDDEDDHPDTKPAFAGARWYENDEAVLLTEKYDLWRVTPDGKNALCLTGNAGKDGDLQFRCINPARNTIHPALKEVGVTKPIGKKELLYLSTFDRKSKQNGYSTVYSNKAGLKSSFIAPFSFQNIYKALDAEVMAFRKGDFRKPYDVYVTKDNWKTETKLSAINPWIKDYFWGDAKLVRWKAYDSTELEGILYTPENLDTNGKYPMLVYFYEKNSQNLYNHVQPAPSRSIICFPFYVSRGYAVFVPDVKYVEGHPGESAYNCICSGTEAMCEQFRFIDRKRMGIQGQSWGGYQTAYLVTRTDMYAAAGAGAPVGNMISAYGGIRWESGNVRSSQYEHGQSRIGRSPWDRGGLKLYVENSPILYIENVTTPVLIMHNDNDGAVPWYQGIEFFLALRRFDHPAWLLEYNNEAHNLVERRNCKDLSIRMQQFFDHYLKGDPMPAWMKKSIPITRKGQYFGLETK